MVKRGSSPAEARCRIEHPDGKHFKIDNFMEVIESDLRFDYESTLPYQDYLHVGRDLRNKIVHEGYTASKEEALYANLYAQRALRTFVAAFIPEFGRWDLLWQHFDRM